MSIDPFIIHGHYPNDNSNNRDFNNLFLQKTFLCMERLHEPNLKKTNEPYSFDCKEYKTIDDAIDKFFEEDKISKNTRRMKIIQLPVIIPEAITNDALSHILKKNYWGLVRKS
jgi:hypothetical protein